VRGGPKRRERGSSSRALDGTPLHGRALRLLTSGLERDGQGGREPVQKGPGSDSATRPSSASSATSSGRGAALAARPVATRSRCSSLALPPSRRPSSRFEAASVPGWRRIQVSRPRSSPDPGPAPSRNASRARTALEGLLLHPLLEDREVGAQRAGSEGWRHDTSASAYRSSAPEKPAGDRHALS